MHFFFSSQPGTPIMPSHLLPDRVNQHVPPIPDGSLLLPLLGKNLQTYFHMSSLGHIQEARLCVGIRESPQSPTEFRISTLLYYCMVSFCLLLFVYKCFVYLFISNFRIPHNLLRPTHPTRSSHTFFMSLDHKSQCHFDNVIKNEGLPSDKNN